MKNKLMIILIAIRSATALAAGEIQGKVLDATTGGPLFMANVSVRTGSGLLGAVTGSDGRFVIKPLEAGYYDVIIQFMGCHPDTVRMVRVNSDRITRLGDVVLSPVIELTAFEVKEDRFSGNERLINVDVPTLSTILYKDIKNNPLARDPLAMAATMPGVKQREEGGEISFRGARGDAGLYIVDGIRMRGDQIVIPAVAIGEMNIYTGGVPARYGDFTGGVIVIETRSYFEIWQERQAERAAQ